DDLTQLRLEAGDQDGTGDRVAAELEKGVAEPEAVVVQGLSEELCQSALEGALRPLDIGSMGGIGGIGGIGVAQLRRGLDRKPRQGTAVDLAVGQQRE